MLRKVLTPHGSDGAEDKEAYGGVEEEAAAGQGEESQPSPRGLQQKVETPAPAGSGLRTEKRGWV